MRYVRIEWTGDGFCIDASPYLQQLPQLAESLPTGARAFDTDPEHYSFNGQRYIKNLKPQRLVSGEGTASAGSSFSCATAAGGTKRT